MAQAFLYVVKDAAGRDYVFNRGKGCTVPWRIDDEEVFFGPCKKRLREILAKARLQGKDLRDTFIVGVSPGNSSRSRTVLWAGRIKRLMTFAEAYTALQAEKYQKMRRNNNSPLHLKPIEDRGRLVGYEHYGDLHSGDASAQCATPPWVDDLVSSRPPQNPDVRIEGRDRLFVQGDANPAEAFPRDVCALCTNMFFAYPGGPGALEVDQDLVAILQRAQPNKPIDCYAIFGYRKDRSAEGMTGRYLLLAGADAEMVTGWISSRARAAAKREHT